MKDCRKNVDSGEMNQESNSRIFEYFGEDMISRKELSNKYLKGIKMGLFLCDKCGEKDPIYCKCQTCNTCGEGTKRRYCSCMAFDDYKTAFLREKQLQLK